ncbi:MAG: drug/metabolite transporter (DMT)-like permease [Patiriisocius sp.]
MRIQDFAALLLLGAIWGSSFMLIKWAAPEFGIFALVEVRAIGATLLLLPFVFLKRQQKDLFLYWRQLLVVGLLNTAIPFCLFNYSLLHIEAGLAAILNGTAPMFGMLVAYLYLKEKISPVGLIGMLLGFAGVVLISYEQTTGANTSMLPVAAILLATLCYGAVASYLKHKLSHVKPFAIAAGSQFFASLVLLPFALMNLPEVMPSSRAIASALVLAFVCTGLAYILYFNLIAKVGVSRALTVGYLVPLFGVLWGYIVLNESLTPSELVGGGLVLLGVMLATNILSRFKRKTAIVVPK